jgi:hypothetical protein
VGAAEALEVVEDRGATQVVGLDVVVLEEVPGGAAWLGAFTVSFVDDPGLASCREASSGAGIDGLALRVVLEQRDDRVG